MLLLNCRLMVPFFSQLFTSSHFLYHVILHCTSIYLPYLIRYCSVINSFSVRFVLFFRFTGRRTFFLSLSLTRNSLFDCIPLMMLKSISKMIQISMWLPCLSENVLTQLLFIEEGIIFNFNTFSDRFLRLQL